MVDGPKTYNSPPAYPAPAAPNPNMRPNPPLNPNTGAPEPGTGIFPSARGFDQTGPYASPNNPDNPQVNPSPGNPNSSDDSAFQSGAKASMKPLGNSGTQIFGGYYNEEYLNTLRGRRAAKIWDEMRRSEAQISMILNAITNPIKSANWDIEAADESNPDYVKQAELCKKALFEMIDFNTFKHEALTFMPFGFSMFEVVHNVIFDDPVFGTFNGLKSLAFRSQKTIENWQLEPQTGALIGVNQYTYSDIGGNQFIPGAFLLVFTHSKEGDNYEGISVLRPMYGAYSRKNLYLKLAAIGIEKYAVGTPIGTVPPGKEKTTEFTAFSTTLQNFTSHESAYLIKPQGWEIEIQKNEFDASKLKEMLVFENTEMVNAVVANFLALGMNGGGGAYALGSNLGEFFTSGIQAYADLICDAVNRDLFTNLIKLNFGPQACYPKLKCTGITDKAGKELAETIKFLSDARAIDPDMPLKEFIRKQYKLPKPDPSTAVALPVIPAGASANYPKQNDPVINPTTGKVEPFNPSQIEQTDDPNDANAQAAAAGVVPPAPKLSEERTIRLADSKHVKKFDRNKTSLKSLMQDNLEILYSNLKDVLRKKYKSASGSAKLMVAKGVETPGLNAYKSALKDALGKIAIDATNDAKAMVPKRLKNVKLSIVGYDKLNPKVRAIIETQASLIAETQAADIEKNVFFSFTTSAAASDDIDNILTDVDEKVEPMIDGSTAGGMSIDAAAGDAVGTIMNQSSLNFFMDPAVSGGIESYTFTNEDPISEICQELAGTTFAPGDSDLDTYFPPLHHNCKSRMVPNFIGDDENPDIDTGAISISQKAADSITLGELTTFARKHIKTSNFVFPKEKRYPIHDLNHARNALARSSGTPDESAVKEAVYRKYPQLKKD